MLPFFVLPNELIDNILHLVIMNLLDLMTTRVAPISVVRDYRALLLTCKYFKAYFDRPSPRIAMRHTAVSLLPNPSDFDDFDEFLVPQMWLVQADNSLIAFNKRTRNTPVSLLRVWQQWVDIFQVYQKVSARSARPNFRKDCFDVLGKFWLNPKLRLRDLERLCGRKTAPQLLLLLGPALQRRACPLHEFVPHPHKSWDWKPEFWVEETNSSLNYHVGDVLNIIKTYWSTLNCQYVYSVRDWRHPSHGWSGSAIAPEVSEWWIWWGIWNEELVTGYHQEKAWVFEVVRGVLWTNFEPGSAIGWDLVTEPIFQKCWVSQWLQKSTQETFKEKNLVECGVLEALRTETNINEQDN